MNAPRATSGRLAEALAWVLLAAALGLVAWALLATTFMIYDDEGYVLWSLKSVAEGAPLYTEVFSQYGPFPYVLHRLLGAAGYPFTSDAARAATLVCWLGAAALAGLTARRLSGPVAGLACAFCAFLALADMRNEPGHPGGLLALFAALAAWLGVRWIAGGRWTAFALVQPALGAAMLLSKINVGVFHVIATAGAWPFAAPQVLGPGLRRALLAAGAVAGAVVLMSGLLGERPVQVYCAIFCCAAVPLALLAPAPERREPPGRILGLALAGGGALAALVIGATLLGGTRAADLLHDGLLAPLRHPGVYHHFFKWHAAALPLALGSAALFAVHHFGPAAWRRPILIAGRLGAAAALLRGWSLAELAGMETMAFQYLPPLAWMLATPLDDQPAPIVRARWWLAWFACWHALQAYPVAGSQVGWGSFTLLPLAFIGWHDLVAGRPRARLALGAALVVLTVATFLPVARIARSSWESSEPLDLPGARQLRLDRVSASTWRTVAANVEANATTLFTYPGMLSFNRWTGVPPPTSANVTHWFSLLDETRQLAIRDRLEADPTAVVVVQRTHLHYLIERGLGPAGPLKDYLHTRYRPALRLDGFDVWVRPGQPFTPVGVARIVEPAGAARLVAFTTAAPAAVARLEFHPLAGPAAPVAAPLPWTPDWTAAAWTPRIARLTVPLGGDPLPELAAHTEVRLLDAAGRVLDRLRLDLSPLPAEAFTAAAPPR